MWLHNSECFTNLETQNFVSKCLINNKSPETRKRIRNRNREREKYTKCGKLKYSARNKGERRQRRMNAPPPRLNEFMWLDLFSSVFGPGLCMCSSGASYQSWYSVLRLSSTDLQLIASNCKQAICRSSTPHDDEPGS